VDKRLRIPILVLGLTLGTLCSAGLPAGAREGTGFTFAVLGDRTGGAVEGVFEQVVRDVEFLNPDLVLTVGDHIEGYLPDSAAIEAEWDYVVGLLDGMAIPYRLTPGNHDIWDARSRRIYAKRFGSPDAAFVHMNSLFVILDVSMEYKAEGLPAERTQWLEQELSKAKNHTHTFVFYHKPFWCEDFSFERQNLLHDVFVRHGVDAVFTGHYHRHFYTERDGIRYFGVSSSGGSVGYGGREVGAFYSYLLARVEGEDLEVRVLEPGLGESPDIFTMEDKVRMEVLEAEALSIEDLEVTGPTLDGTAKIEISVHNTGTATIRDTARWSLAGDWMVESPSSYVEVPPGETGTITAYFSNNGDLFPAPQLEVGIASENGEIVRVSKPLPVRRVLEAARLDTGPEIDGRLEEVWQSIDPESRYFGYGHDQGDRDSTSLRVCHDGGHVYVAVEAFASDMDSIRAFVESRDGFGGYDDYVLVLFEPEIGSNVFYQVAVNPRGTVFDKHVEICPFGTYVQDYSWDPPLTAAAQILDDRWVVELSIPIESLNPGGRDSERWGFNFRRMHKHKGAISDYQLPLWYASDRLGRITFR
jgi:hypothetical protein